MISIYIDIDFHPAHFNHNCGCNIPAYWRAEVVDLTDLFDYEYLGHHCLYIDDADKSTAIHALMLEIQTKWSDKEFDFIVIDE